MPLAMSIRMICDYISRICSGLHVFVAVKVTLAFATVATLP